MARTAASISGTLAAALVLVWCLANASERTVLSGVLAFVLMVVIASAIAGSMGSLIFIIGKTDAQRHLDSRIHGYVRGAGRLHEVASNGRATSKDEWKAAELLNSAAVLRQQADDLHWQYKGESITAQERDEIIADINKMRWNASKMDNEAALLLNPTPLKTTRPSSWKRRAASR
jgi:hypothetical protein